MTYSDMIEKIMPEVRDGGTEPILIYRDADGGWHGDFTRNQYGETFDWVEDAINADELAFTTRGLDFADGSYPYVFDKVLCQRLSIEYHNLSLFDSAATNAEREEHGKTRALLNFFEGNVSEFSQETLDYLIGFDQPLKALTGLCPFNMQTGREDWMFNEHLTPDAIDAIERRVETLLEGSKTEIIDSTQEGRNAEAKRVIDGYTEKFSVALAGREVFLAVNEKEDAPYLVCTARWDNPFGATEYFGGEVTVDYVEALRTFVDRVDILLGVLEKERAAFPTFQPMLTAADCITGGLSKSLTNQVVVIKPEVLSPEYRTANHQLKIVRGGFGANPNARGNAVFCKDLYSDKETRFERYDIAGVVDPAKLPQWAKDKLAYLEALKELGVFAFGDYHFKPIRKFEQRDGDFHEQMSNAVSDRGMGIANYEWGKTAYSHAAFYAASGDSEADIFMCAENGRLYVPCANELFVYNEPPVKTQEKDAPPKKPSRRAEEPDKKKPSILGDLDASVKEAEQRAERKGGSQTKKRGGLEVD